MYLKILLITLSLTTISLFGNSIDKKKIEIYNNLQKVSMSGGDYLGYSKYISDYLEEWHNIKSKKKYRRRSWRDRKSINPIDLFSGGIAIRESLQLDRISLTKEDKSKKDVLLSSLKGPQIKSHPFKKMLGNREYKLSELSTMVPIDFYYIHISSFTKGLNLWDDLMIKLKAFYKRAETSNVDYRIKDKIMRQIALKENKLLRGFYDSVVEDAVIVGSDPFIITGSDITILFNIKNHLIFDASVKDYRSKFKKEYKTKNLKFKIDGYSVDYLYTNDRKINSYYVKLNNKHSILSNSKTALTKVLNTYKNRKNSLGNSYEYKYMRSIYKLNDNEEFFIYMSDSFIRRVVGADVRLKESQRVIEQFKLTKMQNLLLLYYSLYKRYPNSIKDLIRGLDPTNSKIDNTISTPSSGKSFRERENIKKEKNHYKYFMELSKNLKLSKDKKSIESTLYGKLGYFQPNIDNKIKYVSQKQAKDYKNFMNNYNNYWKEYFDPIGIKISTKDNKIAINTHILPLINSSMYNQVQAMIGGKPIKLKYKKLPTEWLKISFKITENFKKMLPKGYNELNRELFRIKNKQMINFNNILGDNITFSIMDGSPLVDFNTKRLFTEMLSSSRNFDMGLIAFFATALAHPVRMTLPLKNIKLFKNELDLIVRNLIKNPIHRDLTWRFYKKTYKRQTYTVATLSFWKMITFRFYFTITKNELEIATTEKYMKNIIDFSYKEQKVIKSNRNIAFSFYPNSINLEKEFFDNMLIDNLIDNNLKNIRTLSILRSIYGKELTSNQFYNNFGFNIKNPLDENYKYKEKTIYHPTLSGYKNDPIDIQKLKEKILDKYYEIKTFQLEFEFTDTGIDTRIIIE